MLKLIASDMDGTLLNEKIKIPKANAQAVKEAQQQGVHFLIATGRSYDQAYPLMEEAGLVSPIIALNGAQMFDENGKLLFSRGLEKDSVLQMLNDIRESGSHGEIMTTDGIFSDSREKRLKAFAYMMQDINPQLSFEEAMNYSEKRMKELNVTFVNDYEEVIDKDSLAVLKVSAYHEEGTAVLEPLTEEILSEQDELAITSSSHNNIEINHQSAQKGIALQEYADRLDIQSKEVMAIGDNINDLSMLEWAGYSFAMENARSEAKQAATYRTSSNDKNGVAEAITLLLLERQEILQTQKSY